MLVLGHRGSGVTMFNRSAIGPERPAENTVQSCLKALREGADGLEIDVMMTADNDLAVIHDDILNFHLDGADRNERTEGHVHEMTLTALKRKSLNAGYRIASLPEIFKVAADHNGILNIELTGRGTHKKALGIARHYAATNALGIDKVVFSSFSFDELADLRAKAPDVKIGLLFEASAAQEELMHIESPGSYMSRHFSRDLVENVWDKVKPTSLNPNIVDFNDEFLAYARRKNCEVYLWSYAEKPPAEDPRTRAVIVRYGREPDVHLITDYPGLVKRALSLG